MGISLECMSQPVDGSLGNVPKVRLRHLSPDVLQCLSGMTRLASCLTGLSENTDGSWLLTVNTANEVLARPSALVRIAGFSA